MSKFYKQLQMSYEDSYSDFKCINFAAYAQKAMHHFRTKFQLQ